MGAKAVRDPCPSRGRRDRVKRGWMNATRSQPHRHLFGVWRPPAAPSRGEALAASRPKSSIAAPAAGHQCRQAGGRHRRRHRRRNRRPRRSRQQRPPRRQRRPLRPSRRPMSACMARYSKAAPSSSRLRDRPSGPFAIAPTAATSPADIAAVKRVIEAVPQGQGSGRQCRRGEHHPIRSRASSPNGSSCARDNTNPTFQRYAAFVEANPSWPHSPLFRRRAENALWNDGVDDATVRAFFARQQPVDRQGPLTCWRAPCSRRAIAKARPRWCATPGAMTMLSAEVEKQRARNVRRHAHARADHKVRMEQRFYADDVAAGLRAAERLGGDDLQSARARAAVLRKAGNAKALLDAVPAAAQQRRRLHLRAACNGCARTTRRKKPAS